MLRILLTVALLLGVSLTGAFAGPPQVAPQILVQCTQAGSSVKTVKVSVSQSYFQDMSYHQWQLLAYFTTPGGATQAKTMNAATTWFLVSPGTYSVRMWLQINPMNIQPVSQAVSITIPADFYVQAGGITHCNMVVHDRPSGTR